MATWIYDMPKPSKRALKSATRNRELIANGTRQTIGRPGGPKAKGHKTPATGTLPYIRSSVIPNGNMLPTVSNAKRAKSLATARKRKIRAAKTSVE
jgi:hypothetical protein